MICEILREILALENIDDATSEQVLLLIQRMEGHRAQNEALDNIKKAKDFDSIG